MAAEFEPFLKEESDFANAKFYMKDEECHSIEFSMSSFKIKRNIDDRNTFIIVPSHQLIRCKSKFTYERLSKGRQPQMELTDVEELRK